MVKVSVGKCIKNRKTRDKIVDTKNYFFRKCRMINKVLTGLVSIRNDRGDITTDSTDNKRIIREYYKQHYAYKFYSTNEMDKFFKRHTLLNFTQEEIDNLNRPIY